MANTCREAIVEIFANVAGVLETKQVINSIYARYPSRPWKPNTIAAHLVTLSDHPSKKETLRENDSRSMATTFPHYSMWLSLTIHLIRHWRTFPEKGLRLDSQVR